MGDLNPDEALPKFDRTSDEAAYLNEKGEMVFAFPSNETAVRLKNPDGSYSIEVFKNVNRRREALPSRGHGSWLLLD